MPYAIIGNPKTGYFVINVLTGRKYSKKPFKSLISAKKQLMAIRINSIS